MTIFWLVAALFVLGALLFLLPALLRPRPAAASVAEANLAVHRDQLREAEADLAAGLIGADRLQQTRNEIVRRMLEDDVAGGALPAASAPSRGTALFLALLLPVASVLSYLKLGAPEAMSGPPAAVAQPETARHGTTPEQIARMAGVLAERLQARPDDAEGWLTLGRSYLRLGRYADAAAALRRAVEFSPPNAGLLADLADVTGMAQGRRLSGEPARLIQQALDIDPRHAKALALAGSVAFETRDYGAARGYWDRLAAVVPPGSEMARSVQVNIAQALQLEGGLQPVAARAATALPTVAPAAGQAVHGRVEISPEMAARVKAGATLYVFARATEGPRMPLAILRLPASARGADFTLDDSMAMAPELRLSAFRQVVVGARISASGSATPQSGDLVGQSGAVVPGTRGVRVLISALQP